LADAETASAIADTLKKDTLENRMRKARRKLDSDENNAQIDHAQKLDELNENLARAQKGQSSRKKRELREKYDSELKSLGVEREIAVNKERQKRSALETTERESAAAAKAKRRAQLIKQGQSKSRLGTIETVPDLGSMEAEVVKVMDRMIEAQELLAESVKKETEVLLAKQLKLEEQLQSELETRKEILKVTNQQKEAEKARLDVALGRKAELSLLASAINKFDPEDIRKASTVEEVNKIMAARRINIEDMMGRKEEMDPNYDRTSGVLARIWGGEQDLAAGTRDRITKREEAREVEADVAKNKLAQEVLRKQRHELMNTPGMQAALQAAIGITALGARDIGRMSQDFLPGSGWEERAVDIKQRAKGAVAGLRAGTPGAMATLRDLIDILNKRPVLTEFKAPQWGRGQRIDPITGVKSNNLLEKGQQGVRPGAIALRKSFGKLRPQLRDIGVPWPRSELVEDWHNLQETVVGMDAATKVLLEYADQELDAIAQRNLLNEQMTTNTDNAAKALVRFNDAMFKFGENVGQANTSGWDTGDTNLTFNGITDVTEIVDLISHHLKNKERLETP
jgi:hypothetical protein